MTMKPINENYYSGARYPIYPPFSPYYNDLVYRPWNEWPYQQWAFPVVPDVPKPEVKLELVWTEPDPQKKVWCLFVECDDEGKNSDLVSIYATNEAAETALAARTEQYERAILAIRNAELDKQLESWPMWAVKSWIFDGHGEVVDTLVRPKLDESPIESPYYIEEWLVKE